MKGISLFSSAGIAETYFSKCNIHIVGASELILKRSDLHGFLYPECEMVVGDIAKKSNFERIEKIAKQEKCEFLLATPPCQGMSTLGKKDYDNDKRNYLIFYAIDLIDKCNFNYVLIENVPKFLKLYFPYNGKLMLLTDIFKEKYSDTYEIDSFVLNAKDYGVPQSRPRGFIRLWKKGLKWGMPEIKSEITLYEAIGNLQSLESGEDSGIKWHFAKIHNEREILAMKHTDEGKSALKNEIYFPKKPNGEAIKGFHNTYSRMRRNEPCPARAMNNGNMGGHNNVHPGRPLPDGTRTDTRVLTLRELFIVSSLPPDWNLPTWCTDNFIRTVIGEAIPPLFAYNILLKIGKE